VVLSFVVNHKHHTCCKRHNFFPLLYRLCKRALYLSKKSPVHLPKTCLLQDTISSVRHNFFCKTRGFSAFQNVCMYIHIYIYTYVCVCVYICIFVYIPTYLYIKISTCIYVYVYTYTKINIFVQIFNKEIFVCIYICIYVRKYAYIYIYIYICMYIYLYVYAYIHYMCIYQYHPYCQLDRGAPERGRSPIIWVLCLVI